MNLAARVFLEFFKRFSTSRRRAVVNQNHDYSVAISE